MTEETVVEETTETGPDELTLLKTRAGQMGLSFHPKIGVESLRDKINEKLAGGKPTDADEAGEPVKLTPAQAKAALRVAVRREALKLVRVRISNLNPQKNDLNGEVFTIANKYIGEVKKYIPYGEASDNGYHIPMCIYNNLKSRKYLQLRTIKSQTLGKPDTVKQRWVPEFSLEVLDPLTKEELHELARVQEARAGGLED